MSGKKITTVIIPTDGPIADLYTKWGGPYGPSVVIAAGMKALDQMDELQARQMCDETKRELRERNSTKAKTPVSSEPCRGASSTCPEQGRGEDTAPVAKAS